MLEKTKLKGRGRPNLQESVAGFKNWNVFTVAREGPIVELLVYFHADYTKDIPCMLFYGLSVVSLLLSYSLFVGL